jgi:DNA-binding LacI/PurR family transcriptional regulator
MVPPPAGAVTSNAPVLMVDVAARAGVSTMTVSRVLSGHTGVRPETRRRVEAAVAALGYRANTAARTLAGGRSGVIGVVSINTSYVGPSNIVFGIEAAAREHDLVVSFVTMRRVDAEEMTASLAHLRDLQVDGVVVIAPSRAAIEALPTDFDLPLVVMCGEEIVGRSTVAVDQRAGARLATGHLLDLGHETVQHIRGPRGWIDADARESGWRGELRAHRRRAPRAYLGDWTARSGFLIGREIARDVRATAVFVANDQMALGLLLALAESGRQVPTDVQVVGFDGLPESEFFAPPLTTVRQDFSALGRHSVNLLLRILDGDASEQHIAVPPELVARRSA